MRRAISATSTTGSRTSRRRSGPIALVLAQVPNDRLTHDRLGGIYAAQDRTTEAIAEFTKSLPETSAYGHLVDLHRRLGDIKDFEAKYKAAADELPDDAEAQYAIGAIYVAERKSEDGVTYLRRAVGLQPRSCPVLSELGSAYLDLGQMDKASEVSEPLSRDQSRRLSVTRQPRCRRHRNAPLRSGVAVARPRQRGRAGRARGARST